MGIRALVLFLLPMLAVANDHVLDKAAADAVNSFSVDFLKEVLRRNKGNVATSPVSVSTLLAILHQGADGNTKAQLTQALHGEPEQILGVYKKITHSLKNVSNGTLLEFANGIFLNEGYKVLPKFKQHIEEDFLSEIATANFSENTESAEQINKWVSDHTHDKIKQLVQPEMLSSFTLIVLVNAIYFKDIWMKPFRPEITQTETFYADSEKQVPMMHMHDIFKTGFLDEIQAQWLEMPFQGERFSMIVVLPKERNGLQNTLTQMTSEHISKLLSNAKQGYAENVILSMPKFKIASALKLVPILVSVFNKTSMEFDNGIFLNKGYKILPKFEQHLRKKDFLSETATANLTAGTESNMQINTWISEQTHDKIKQLVQPALVVLLLPILAFANSGVLDEAASNAINSFSVDFLKEVLKTNKGNMAMSPVSVSTLLAILHQGADGNTKTQLTQALQGEPEQTSGVYRRITHSLKNVSNGTLLEFANGIFLNEGYQVLPKFKQHLEEDFLSEIIIANFTETIELAEQINNWVSSHTHDKIKDVARPGMLTALTRMVLVNAIYFKDMWLHPFKPEDTRMEIFYGGSDKHVPMMKKIHRLNTGFLEEIQAQWLEMPFQGKRFSMIVVLPKEKNGLQNTLTQMTSEIIFKLLRDLKQGYIERVILTMPKFKIASTLKLIPILKLKIPELFSDRANLPGISKEAIYPSEVVQKAEVEVDERGATAAAATLIEIQTRFGIPSPDVIFNANHPFLVFIVDTISKVILFVGQVSDPLLA